VTPFPALDRIIGNLWWTWTPDARALVESVHPRSWRDARGVLADYLSAVPAERWQQLAENPAFQESLADIDGRLTAYLEDEETWWARRHGDKLPGGIAYFAAEYAVHEGLPIYSGGLGILAADHLKSASDLGIPMAAVGLYYREGYFTQRLDEEGQQVEHYVARPPEQVGLQRAMGCGGQPLEVFVPLEDRYIRCEVWKAQLGRVPLYLLDTDVAGNRGGDRWLTRQLYGGDPNNRIRQEVVLGIGGLRALRGAGHAPDVVHLNEGHTAFAILERVHEEMGRGLDREAAWEATRQTVVFTTHTPLDSGHDRFWPGLVGHVLGPYDQLLDLPIGELTSLGRARPEDSDELVMPVLALRGARAANSVSARHDEMSRQAWGDIDGVAEDLWTEPVTVGVHAPSWVGPEIQRVLDQYVGSSWRKPLRTGRRLNAVEDVPTRALWDAHLRQKQRLIQFVAHRTGKRIDARSLIIGWASRFAAFKRADLVLADPGRLARILTDEEQPMVLLFAGKAHPRDGVGKRLIRTVHELAERPEMEGRIIFVPDHDIAVGRSMVQGVDLWLNCSRRTLEPTGLSGQKAAINGALNCATLAGWWMEGYQLEPMSGWAVGKARSREDTFSDLQDAEALYTLLEYEVAPLFWDRAGDGMPDEWVRWMAASMAAFLPAFNTDRMVADYVSRSYLRESPDAPPADPARPPAPAPSGSWLSPRRRRRR
jgi:glycogen phosphorylase